MWRHCPDAAARGEMELSSILLERGSLTDASLRAANLCAAMLEGTELEGVDLTGAIISDSKQKRTLTRLKGFTR
jgi:uncharacterized protein YjbI with pentapeptide repeats